MSDLYNSILSSLNIDEKIAQKLVNISLCQGCHKLNGNFAQKSFVTISPIRTAEILPISSLINSTFVGNYSKESRHHEEVFGVKSCCQNPSVWNVMLYQLMPPVLVFKIDRTQVNSDILVKSPILVDLELYISEYAAYKHEKNTKYSLATVICHEAISKRSGHFITHLRVDQNTMKTIDDDRKQATSRISNFTKINSVQSTVYMTIYFQKKDEEVKHRGPKNYHFNLNESKQQIVEKTWFGLTELVASSLIVSTGHERRMSKETVHRFLEAITIQANTRNKKQFCSLSLEFFDSLEAQDFYADEMESVLASKNLMDLDALLIPVYHKNDDHWTLVSMFPRSKTMVHANSIRNDRLLVNIFQSLLSFVQFYSALHCISFRKAEWVLISPRHI